MSTGFSTPLVHSTRSTQEKYPYRAGMGLTSSAEFSVFFDDFFAPVATNVPDGWSAAIIDTGATTVTDTTAAIGATGVLLMSDATASEGAAFYGAKSIQLTAGKKFFMEMKFRTDDVTDNAIQFGLTDLTAVVNPEDLWTTTAANLVAAGILDGAATTKLLADKSNSGSTAETGTRSLSANTNHVMAIYYNGAGLQVYVDGKLSQTWAQAASTIPTGVALAPFVGVLNGNGAGGNNNYIDYVRWVLER